MTRTLTDSMAAPQADAKQRFLDLLETHRGIVVKVARMYAWHADERAELAQEILAQLWYAFGKYDESRSFSTWMYRIALNVAISQVRKSVRRRRYLDDSSLDPDEFPAEHAAEPGDSRVEFLLAFIGRLEALDRALMLLYLEERSYREIADVLGISETNVATKVARLKKRVQRDSERAGL